MNQRQLTIDAASALVPLPAAVDLIRCGKNLLPIGFFGAPETRHNNRSTSDRDKYIAFVKIARYRRAKLGRIENPIRFTCYQLLKELGLSFSGENYEDINRWDQRMAGATITSEQVICLEERKKYAIKVVHVFPSFVRAAQSDHEVIPEDFPSYRKLKRATGNRIFGYLHLWLHANRGRPLDELAATGYLSSQNIRRIGTKEGCKLVLQPGAELPRASAISQRKSLPDVVAAVENLFERGVSEARAQSLARRQYPVNVIGRIEYAERMMGRDRKGKFENPDGFIIHMIENRVPAPANFPTSRRFPGRRQPVAGQFPRRELQQTMRLPGFEEWCESSA